jgi:hypothetical protein
MSQRPAAVGMMACEHVIIEETTRNMTPVNCFNHRTARDFPSEGLTFVVFAVLNDGRGEIALDLKIQRLDTLEVIYQRSVSALFTDQLQEIRCIFRVRDLSFPVSGAYQVSLFAGDEIIAQRKIRVTNKELS